MAYCQSCADLLRELAELRQQQEQLQERTSTWRSWAQFVYLGGGDPLATDDDTLRQLVCNAHDKDTDRLKARAEAAEASLPTLRRDYEHVMAEMRAIAAKWAEQRTRAEHAEE